MCGGTGTRLWPLSRKNAPKQFVNLEGGRSLFDLTIDRALCVPGVTEMVCVSNNQYRFSVLERLLAQGIDGDIILESTPRNTAPALACAAVHILRASGDAIMLCMPSDHICQDKAAFVQAVQLAADAAGRGLLMTLGVEATRATSAYGYIVPGEAIEDLPEAVYVSAFSEKPDTDKASALIAEGAWWNSGMFVMRVSSLISAFEQHAPDILEKCQDAVVNATPDGQFLWLQRGAQETCPSISFDHAVLERHGNCGMIPLRAEWSDVGSWSEIAELTEQDATNNRIEGDVIPLNSRNLYVRSPERLTVTIGVSDLTIVDTPDALLVAATDQTDKVKDAVALIENMGRPEHSAHITVNRPWGHFENIDQGDQYRVKRLTIKPGSAISLQYHQHRSEHWVVVRGSAKVTCNDDIFTLTANQSTFIPQGAVHRLENPSAEPLEIIEVQSGSYLGEDDIVRLEDQFGRVVDPHD